MVHFFVIHGARFREGPRPSGLNPVQISGLEAPKGISIRSRSVRRSTSWESARRRPTENSHRHLALVGTAAISPIRFRGFTLRTRIN